MKTKLPATYLFTNILFAVITIALVIGFFAMLILEFSTASVITFFVILLVWLAAFVVWCASRLERKPKTK